MSLANVKIYLQVLIGLSSFFITILFQKSFGIRHFAEHSFDVHEKPSITISKRWSWPILSAMYTSFFMLLDYIFESGDSRLLFISIMLYTIVYGYVHLFKWELMAEKNEVHSHAIGDNIFHKLGLGRTSEYSFIWNNTLVLTALLSIASLLTGYITAGIYFLLGALSFLFKVIARRETRVQKEIEISDSSIEDKSTLQIFQARNWEPNRG